MAPLMQCPGSLLFSHEALGPEARGGRAGKLSKVHEGPMWNRRPDQDLSSDGQSCDGSLGGSMAVAGFIFLFLGA